MDNTETHLNLTNPNTNNSLTLTPRELTIIWDSLNSNIDLQIKIGDFLDNEGIPTED